MKIVLQQKAKISPLIKMNCIILENSNKNFLIIHNEKEKGKGKLEESNATQMRSEKKLKIIKLNLKQSKDKSQGNKFMFKGQTNIISVSTQKKISRHN